MQYCVVRFGQVDVDGERGVSLGSVLVDFVEDGSER